MINNVEGGNHPAASKSAPSLSDRVRSLRLGERGTTPRATRPSVLPWAVCVILLLMTTAFGFRAYRAGPVAPSGGGSGGERERGGDSKAAFASSASPTGEVALQAKGYVVAVHPVQVSPKVGG